MEADDDDAKWLTIQSVPHHRNVRGVENFLRQTGSMCPPSPTTRARILQIQEEKALYPTVSPMDIQHRAEDGEEAIVVDKNGGFMFLYDLRGNRIKNPHVIAVDRAKALAETREKKVERPREEGKKGSRRRSSTLFLEPAQEDRDLMPITAEPLLPVVASQQQFFNMHDTTLNQSSAGYHNDLSDLEYDRMMTSAHESEMMQIDEHSSFELGPHSDARGGHQRRMSGGGGGGGGNRRLSGGMGGGYRRPYGGGVVVGGGGAISPRRPGYYGGTSRYYGGRRGMYHPYLFVPLIPSTVFLSAALLGSWYPAGQTNYYYINNQVQQQAALPPLPPIYVDPFQDMAMQRDHITQHLNRLRRQHQYERSLGYEIVPEFPDGNMGAVRFVWVQQRVVV